VSYSIQRRRRWRTLATTLTLTVGSLAVPAAALADGQLDPAFNGTGFHVGSAAESTLFSQQDNRVPMVAQTDNKIVIGGSSNGFMTLARYTTAGALDTTFGPSHNGIVQTQFAGTPGSAPGGSGATAMTLDANGDIIVAGFGGAGAMVVARFSRVDGAEQGSVVCYAPFHIDYSARAVSVRPNGSVVLVGYARDRWPTQTVPAGAAIMFGQRAVVTLPAGTAKVTSTTACGTYVSQQGSTGVQIDGLGHDGVIADPTLGARYYDGVAATANNYVVASTNALAPDVTLIPVDQSAWVQRFTGAGVGALDPTFAGTGRAAMAGADLHAVKLAADGTAYVAGETTGGTADARQLLVARYDTAGVLMPAFSGDGIATANVAGGNNMGESLIFQGANVIVGGGANLAGKSAFGMARFNAASGARDLAFGPSGQVATPFGTPSANAYITGMALTTDGFIAVSGRITDPLGAGQIGVAARYYATGTPPPPPPPAASTTGADSITTTSAHIAGVVNTQGTASTWWIEYGATTAYGSQTLAQPLAASLTDVNVGAGLIGLAAGTTYHARVVIASTQGTVPGADVAFTTTGIPAPPTPAAPAAGATTVTGGTKATTTTTIKKVVKKAAKKICVVPKVTGKTINKARVAVYAKGCKVQVTYAASKKRNNTVIAQSRKAGKKLGYRSVVKLTVAKKASAVAKDKKSS
jgi:uncharacterized delta-60 repeat protein